MDHEFAAQMRLSQGCGAGTGIPPQSYRLMSDLDTTPHMPRAGSTMGSAPVYASPEPIIPKLEPAYVHRRPEISDPDRMHVPDDLAERLWKRARYADDD